MYNRVMKYERFVAYGLVPLVATGFAVAFVPQNEKCRADQAHIELDTYQGQTLNFSSEAVASGAVSNSTSGTYFFSSSAEPNVERENSALVAQSFWQLSAARSHGHGSQKLAARSFAAYRMPSMAAQNQTARHKFPGSQSHVRTGRRA
jgi:hypothetical protein